MALRYLGSHQGFIPKATGQIISYVRDKGEFALNRYCQYLQSPEPVGVYARIDRDASPRVVSDADFVWADNADRPVQDWNQLRFEWKEFSVKRRNYSARLGSIALAHNDWKAKEQHLGMVASQAMTNRTNRVIDLLETAGNWEGHADAAGNLNGGAGTWDQASDQPGSPQYNAIRKTLMAAARRINLDTNGVVKPRDLVLLISPECAQAITNSAEIHNYVKFGPFSKAMIEGKENLNAEWGLPPSLYGFELIVEDAPRVTSRPQASETAAAQTGSRVYAKDSDSAILLSRKGGIDGSYGAPSFSTVQLYFLAPYEMAVYNFSDPKNDREEMHVTDMFAEVLAAPQSGYFIQNVL